MGYLLDVLLLGLVFWCIALQVLLPMKQATFFLLHHYGKQGIEVQMSFVDSLSWYLVLVLQTIMVKLLAQTVFLSELSHAS